MLLDSQGLLIGRRMLLVAAAASLMAGCAPVDLSEVTDPQVSARKDREMQMRERWSGRLYQDLVAEMGYAGASMTTPSRPGESRSAVVFGVNDPRSGCVDSFVVINGEEPIIGNYYCR